MNSWRDWLRRNAVVVAFWAAAAIALLVMASIGPVGWDAEGYRQTIEKVRHGADPYAADIAAQQAFHDHPVAGQHFPWDYLYSPMTLLLLRLLGQLPDRLLGTLYGLAVVAGSLLTVRVGYEMADTEERRWLRFVLPAVLFFPGLITDDVILSGNVAYVLYGAVFAAAAPGWKRNRWFWYYAAVLLASIFKAPLLTLLAFPLLTGKRQWLPAGVTAGAGLFLFGIQARIWPQLFREYLQAVQLQFDRGHDFGFGPAGLLGKILSYLGIPHSPATTILYLVFAAAVCVMLAVLCRRVQQGIIDPGDWIPMAMFCTLLLNPRIMKYDLAPFTVPMLLIGWRALRRQGDIQGQARARFRKDGAMVTALAFLLAANAITVAGPSWAPVELTVLLATLVLGARQLYQAEHEESPLAVPVSAG
jgi:Glycosyltransferase family 87